MLSLLKALLDIDMATQFTEREGCDTMRCTMEWLLSGAVAAVPAMPLSADFYGRMREGQG